MRAGYWVAGGCIVTATAIAIACKSAATPPDSGSAAVSAPSTPATEESASTSSSPSSGAIDTGVDPLACPQAIPPISIAKIEPAAVQEASGIAASTLNKDVYWTHNDSGDTARIFAIATSGKLLATVTFDDAKPTDIEDVAIEDTSAGSFLYIADIGDNGATRSEVTIHRIAEPKLTGTDAVTLTVSSQKMRVKYADGAHDAETLLFDPSTRDLLLVTKSFGTGAVHHIGTFTADTTATTAKIATVSIALATSGDISRDSRFIAVRGYSTTASLWTRLPGEPLATVFARRPCSIPIASERQGEAFAFLPSSHGYVTTGEGKNADIFMSVFQ